MRISMVNAIKNLGKKPFIKGKFQIPMSYTKMIKKDLFIFMTQRKNFVVILTERSCPCACLVPTYGINSPLDY